MALDKLADGSTNGGVIHWVAPDTSAVRGAISTKEIQPLTSTNLNADWEVQVDSFSFKAGSGPNVSVSDVMTVIDSKSSHSVRSPSFTSDEPKDHNISCKGCLKVCAISPVCMP